MKELFLDSSPADLSTYLQERRLADLEEVARSAELFLTARKKQLSDRARQGAIRSKTSLPRKKNSYARFVESLVTLLRIVEIKRLKVEDVITVES